MKHRLQGDKKTLASDGRMMGLILALLWGFLAGAGKNLHHGILKPPLLSVTKKKPLHMSDISKQALAEHTL